MNSKLACPIEYMQQIKELRQKVDELECQLEDERNKSEQYLDKYLMLISSLMDKENEA